MNRLPLIGGIIAVLAIIFYGSIFVLNERDQAIVVRFGKIQRVLSEPGLYFKAPFSMFDFDTVQIVEDRLIRLDRDDLRVQVSGGKFYVVDAFLVFRISDARQFRETVSGSLAVAERQLGIRFEDGLRAVYGRRGFQAALSEERLAMMLEVRDQLRPEAAKLGLEIEDVRVLRTDLTNEVSQQTFDRMSAERLAEAERLRARGREAERRIKATADRKVVETKAKAQRKAEVLRGEGEAARNEIFADAFGRDPEFFDFYRSMAAYTTALENSDTTMILSPNSEFFRFFKDANGSTPAKAQ